MHEYIFIVKHYNFLPVWLTVVQKTIYLYWQRSQMSWTEQIIGWEIWTVNEHKKNIIFYLHQ